MTRKDFIEKEYFEWICSQICFRKRMAMSYHKLLSYLHLHEFTYILGMDSNRAEDGIELRYRFGYSRNYPEVMIANYLDNKPCSVLEMMVALAIRCEEHITGDLSEDIFPSKWFWGMVKNLGLISMTNDKFDPVQTDRILDIFLNRNYKKNGEGGLFSIRNCRNDLRTVEIWYQMCWYLDEILEL